MTSKTLRDLARDHAKGNLDKDAYRKARAELIEGILAGSIPVPEHEFRAPLPASDPEDSQDATVPRKHKKKDLKIPELEVSDQTSVMPQRSRPAPSAPAPAPQKTSARSGGSRKVSWILGVILVVLLVAAAFYTSSQSGGAQRDVSVRTTPPTDQPAPLPPPTPQVDNSATRLIGSFLDHENWSEQNLADFVSQWASLPADDRSAATGSVAEGQLATEIYKELLEERALSGVGDPDKAHAMEERLVNFAHQVGINDPRLVVKSAAAGTSSAAPEQPTGTN